MPLGDRKLWSHGHLTFHISGMQPLCRSSSKSKGFPETTCSISPGQWLPCECPAECRRLTTVPLGTNASTTIISAVSQAKGQMWALFSFSMRPLAANSIRVSLLIGPHPQSLEHQESVVLWLPLSRSFIWLFQSVLSTLIKWWINQQSHCLIGFHFWKLFHKCQGKKMTFSTFKNTFCSLKCWTTEGGSLLG